MSEIVGRLFGTGTGYNGHAVELELTVAASSLVLEQDGGAVGLLESETFVSVVYRGFAADDGGFSIDVDGVKDIVLESGDGLQLAVARVYSPVGELLTEHTLMTPIATPLNIEVDSRAPVDVESPEDPFVGKGDTFEIVLVDTANPERVGGRFVLLLGKRNAPDSGGGAVGPEYVLATGRTNASGRLMVDYPRVVLTEASVEVAGQIGGTARTVVSLDSEGRLPSSISVETQFATEDNVPTNDECDCESSAVPRTPASEQLVESPDVFTDDLGVGDCVDLTTPNRTLEEYRYHKILRTTDPRIVGRKPPRRPRIPPNLLDLVGKLTFSYQTLDAETGDSARSLKTDDTQYMASGLSTSAAWREALDPENVKAALAANSLSLSPKNLRHALADPDGFTPIALMTAERETAKARVEGLISLFGGSKPSRSTLNETNPVDWDRVPQTCQAATIAHGHILEYQQTWRADGYSLGDLLYSLPLAPAQKKQVVVVDWDRREENKRVEARRFDEVLGHELSRDRDVSEVVRATITETMRGGSSATTWAAGGGFGLGIPIGGGFLGIGGGGGGGGSSSTAWQSSSRDLNAFSNQNLQDRTVQASHALRNQRATVVQSVDQSESLSIQAEVVANYNHCHAITIEYFEVLKHYRIDQALVGVRECLFIPLIMSRFDDMKALRWRDILERFLRKRRLRRGFSALHRIATAYQGVNYPAGRYADETVTEISGEIRVRLDVTRPRDPREDEETEDYLSGPWNFWEEMFGVDAHRGVYNAFLRNNELRDRIWQDDLAPRVASEFANTLGVSVQLEGENFYRQLTVDVTLVSRYRSGRNHLISFRTRSMPPEVSRSKIKNIRILASRELSSGSMSVVRYASLRYRTEFGTFRLGNTRWLHNDLKVGDPVNFSVFGLSGPEERNPRAEDRENRRQLLRHLNELTEYYHRIVWWMMDPGHRFMLLDGFVAPNSGGRSVASVVENRVIDIIGNCLVMPVAPGYQLDPTIETFREVHVDGDDVSTRINVDDLFSIYRLSVAPDPYRLSLPTKGVFAEAIMGECNACEKKDDTRFWRWEEEPLPDQPTAIESTSTGTRRAAPQDAMPTAFPQQPLVQIQSAPNAPAPTSLGALANLLGQKDLFTDITGLEQNQKNAMAAFKSAMNTAESFGKLAAGQARQQHARKNAGKTLDVVKDAKKKGLLNDDHSKEVAGRLYKVANGATDAEGQKILNSESGKNVLKKAGEAVGKKHIKVTEQTGDRTETVEIKVPGESEDKKKLDEGKGPHPIDINIESEVPAIKQQSAMSCWAAVTAMMISWKKGVSMNEATALGFVGQEYVDRFIAGNGLEPTEKNDFLTAAGMQAHPPVSMPASEFAGLISEHGPVWITSDEDITPKFSVHARLLVGARGDGSMSGTEARFIDPSTGVAEWERFDRLIGKMEELAIAYDDQLGEFIPQVVYFN